MFNLNKSLSYAREKQKEEESKNFKGNRTEYDEKIIEVLKKY